MLTKELTVAIVGAGAIGGVTAAFMRRAGQNVEIVCKHRNIFDKINREGIHITGIKGECQVKIKAVEMISELSGPKDLVFLATKGTDCIAAARELLPFLTPESMVVSLQNGICERALAEVLGKDRIIGCVVGWGASHTAPGEFEVTSEGEFIIGTIDHENTDPLLPIQHLLDTVNPTRISENMIGELYSKLIVNACTNSLGVIAGVRLGRLMAKKRMRSLFIEIIREAMAVAETLQIDVPPAGGGRLDFNQFLKGDGKLADLKRHLMILIIGFKYRRIKSSSLQSLERGRRTEIDFLNGYICDQGKNCGVSTPLNEAIRKMVLEIEEGRRMISLNNIDELLTVD